jgi:hypothetical protein
MCIYINALKNIQVGVMECFKTHSTITQALNRNGQEIPALAGLKIKDIVQ